MLLRKSTFFLFFLVVLPIVCYWGALSGPFLFDDFANLEQLALIEANLSLESIKSFLEARPAGPTGRPIALLSFLLNDYGWPSEAFSFKYTNLMIHVINGLLLLLIVYNLISRTLRSIYAFWVAVVIASLWALNPYNISSVMYVVQRMALLSTFFVFIGVALYIYGRVQIEAAKERRGLCLLLTGYIVGGGLGILAKENAALYVWLILPLEYLFFSKDSRGKTLSFIIWTPALTLLCAFAYKVPDFLYQYDWVRDFSLSERLLSQSRAFFYYLWRYLIPGVGYVGVYADGFEKSISLIEPVSTLLTAVLHLILIGFAVKLKTKAPLFSFGVFFFYIAHLMEGSIVPIELMFEHRNYLPSAFLFLGLADIKAKKEKALVIVLCSFALVNACLLKLQSTYWSDPFVLKGVFLIENQKSERAAVDYAQILEDTGQREKALSVLRGYTSREPAGLHIALNQVAIACSINADTEQDRKILIDSPAKYRGKGEAVTDKVKRLSVMLARGKCQTIDFGDLEKMLDNYRIAYERDEEAKQAELVSRAYVSFYSGSYENFKKNIFDAIRISPNYELAHSACSQFYQLGRYDDACECLQISSEVNDGFESEEVARPDRWATGLCNR